MFFLSDVNNSQSINKVGIYFFDQNWPSERTVGISSFRNVFIFMSLSNACVSHSISLIDPTVASVVVVVCDKSKRLEINLIEFDHESLSLLMLLLIQV